jgi:prophage antirepressor-like protein
MYIENFKYEEETLEIELTKNQEHEFILSTIDVAKGYGVSESNIRETKRVHKDELKENVHFLFLEVETNGGKQRKLFWTKRGVIRLGFFIKSERAKKFRDWSENLIIDVIENETPKKEEQREIELSISEINGELRISHCSIAFESEVKEKLIRNTITKHISDFEKLGQIYFEEEERFNSVGAMNMKRIYLLNEQQTILLFSILRNSELLMKLKIATIRKFSEMRNQLLLSDFNKVQNEKFSNFDTVEGLKKYREFNKELIKLIKLISSQDKKTLAFLDKMNKNLNQKSPIELFGINLID